MRDKKDNSKKKQKSAKKDPPPFEEAFDRCFPKWCESLDSYMEVINFARSEEYGLESDEYTEVHHIVPRSWYEKHGYRIDNSEKNTVRLRMRDHYKVHFYARLCCESEVKRSLQCAFNRMGNILKCDVPEEWLEEKAILIEVQKCDKKFGANGRKGKHHTEEWRRRHSEELKGHPTSEETRRKQSEALKGHSTSEETRNKISESLKGKHPSEETRRKMSESKKGKVNIKNRKREHCILTDPDGKMYNIHDLHEFCKCHFENPIYAKHDLRRFGTYHGWKYETIDKEDK